MLKNMDNTLGHKLFGKSCSVGNLLFTDKSIPYQKYPNESKINGISNGKNMYLKMNPNETINEK
jgi:hypothetical protein